MNKEEFFGLDYALQEMEREFVRESAWKNNVGKKEYFPYIPFHGNNLFELLRGIKDELLFNKKAPKFIDVGAGTGRIVKLATEMGFDASGIEFLQENVDFGRKTFGLSSKQLFQGDGFDLTGEDLIDVRVLYTYHPIKSKTLMSKLHVHLATTANYTTYLVEVLPSYYPVGHVVNTKENLANDKNIFQWSTVYHKPCIIQTY